MIVTMKQRPVDPVFKHPVSTPQARLDALTDAARTFLREQPDGAPVAALARQIGANDGEVRDVVQQLGRDAALFCASRGWAIRLRSPDEVRLLVPANTNEPRILAA